MVETEGPQVTSQYGAYALHAGLTRLYARMRMHTLKRPGTQMHACARTHTQTNNYYSLLFHSKMIRKHASVLRYTYIACLVCLTYVFRDALLFILADKF
jgi:hypothetical protein